MNLPLQRSAYRGRIAPSPTGLLHLGHARTFWIASQRALSANGTLVLRNEDLDPQRSRPQFVDAMIEDLRWLGIAWQEGPALTAEGPHAPYTQSRRTHLYRAAWEQLRRGGWIYPCSCSRRQLSAGASAPHEQNTHHAHEDDDEPVYPGTCRPATTQSLAAVAHGAAPALTRAGSTWRFRVPAGEAVCFTDGHFGVQSYVAGRDFGDFPVWRRDDMPAYQLAVVVDDAAMAVTEVVRGADLLTSTARQMLLNRALGFQHPAWFHCDLLRDEYGRRLAKRQDALSLRALRERRLQPADVLRMAGLSPADGRTTALSNEAQP